VYIQQALSNYLTYLYVFIVLITRMYAFLFKFATSSHCYTQCKNQQH